MYLCLVFVRSLKFDSMSSALAPGMHLNMVACLENFTFLKMKVTITSVGFSVVGPDWRQPVRNMTQLVENRGLLLRSMLSYRRVT